MTQVQSWPLIQSVVALLLLLVSPVSGFQTVKHVSSTILAEGISYQGSLTGEEPAAIVRIDGKATLIREGDIITRRNFNLKVVSLSDVYLSAILSDNKGNLVVLTDDRKSNGPDYGGLPALSSDSPITIEAFNAIKAGMDYYPVVHYLGRPGAEEQIIGKT